MRIGQKHAAHVKWSFFGLRRSSRIREPESLEIISPPQPGIVVAVREILEYNTRYEDSSIALNGGI